MARSTSKKLPGSDPGKKPFDPEVLDRTVIAIPLLRDLEDRSKKFHDVIIDLNLDFHGGREAAQKRIGVLIKRAAKNAGLSPKVLRVDEEKSRFSRQYLFAKLEGSVIRELARLDQVPAEGMREIEWTARAIHRIWPDFPITPLITKSTSTVKADAAQNAFAAFGEGIVWAVMDSGIAPHSHFDQHENLKLVEPLEHRDFSVLGGTPATALLDEFGHGTHVAGIIAGAAEEKKKGAGLFAAARYRDETGKVTVQTVKFDHISGMAARCKLLSLKVLDGAGQGKASNLIAAISYIQEMNGHGRFVRIHGLNMSVGYDFEPEWFACGQSPLCVEVNRLVKSGVVVVVAAGNTGYGFTASQSRGAVASGLSLTINDPGNAECAITVGSTHREMPHVYGVSYFSSKGPTGDGRQKPDLVAPGEKILSCATERPLKKVQAMLDTDKTYQYVEDSGTSMAAPHVSGAVAAFLSIRREFIGRPEEVKQIFMDTATDLKRDVYFQGRGLVDLMRAIQSV
ncbi:MAG: S8 family peptidase [Chthoniobacterales bacterium]